MNNLVECRCRYNLNTTKAGCLISMMRSPSQRACIGRPVSVAKVRKSTNDLGTLKIPEFKNMGDYSPEWYETYKREIDELKSNRSISPDTEREVGHILHVCKTLNEILKREIGPNKTRAELDTFIIKLENTRGYAEKYLIESKAGVLATLDSIIEMVSDTSIAIARQYNKDKKMPMCPLNIDCIREFNLFDEAIFGMESLLRVAILESGTPGFPSSWEKECDKYYNKYNKDIFPKPEHVLYDYFEWLSDAIKNKRFEETIRYCDVMTKFFLCETGPMPLASVRFKVGVGNIINSRFLNAIDRYNKARDDGVINEKELKSNFVMTKEMWQRIIEDKRNRYIEVMNEFFQCDARSVLNTVFVGGPEDAVNTGFVDHIERYNKARDRGVIEAAKLESNIEMTKKIREQIEKDMRGKKRKRRVKDRRGKKRKRGV